MEKLEKSEPPGELKNKTLLVVNTGSTKNDLFFID